MCVCVDTLAWHTYGTHWKTITKLDLSTKPNGTKRNETKRKMWTIQTNDTKMEHEKKNRGEKQMASRANRIS